MKLLPRTKSQMAHEMGICLRTFQRKLKKANLNIPRGLISPSCQLKIYQALQWFPISTELNVDVMKSHIEARNAPKRPKRV